MKKGLLILLLIVTQLAVSQIGGNGVYQVLNLEPSARTAALSGKQISWRGKELSSSFQNPAILESRYHGMMSLSYVNYLADIQYGNAAYAHDFSKLGTMSFQVQYLDYGDFTAADVAGNIEGEFTASEVVIGASLSRQLDSNFYVGATVKLINSALENYTSFGISSDIGIAYVNEEKQFGFGGLVKNLGTQLSYYTGTTPERLPFDVQVGITKRLAHAPFRVSITAHHLYKWDMTGFSSLYPQFEKDPLTGETRENTIKFADKLFRHFNFGVEFLPGDNLHFRFGLDCQRRAELKMDSKAGAVGFSGGVGLKLKRFGLGVAFVKTHLAATQAHFSISTKLADFKKSE